METVERAIIRFFEQVAQKNEDQLNRLKEARCFHLDREHWRFTLPDLHTFLQCHDVVFRSVDYRRFRKLVFNSPINAAIKPFNAEIVIADNRAKADRSRYALVWHSAGPESGRSRDDTENGKEH